MTEEWGMFFVDRVRVPLFGYSGHGFCVCDVQAFLCSDHSDIEQFCGFPDFLRSLLVKERIDIIGCFKDDYVLKLNALWTVETNTFLFIHELSHRSASRLVVI